MLPRKTGRSTKYYVDPSRLRLWVCECGATYAAVTPSCPYEQDHPPTLMRRCGRWAYRALRYARMKTPAIRTHFRMFLVLIVSLLIATCVALLVVPTSAPVIGALR